MAKLFKSRPSTLARRITSATGSFSVPLNASFHFHSSGDHYQQYHNHQLHQHHQQLRSSASYHRANAYTRTATSGSALTQSSSSPQRLVFDNPQNNLILSEIESVTCNLNEFVDMIADDDDNDDDDDDDDVADVNDCAGRNRIASAAATDAESKLGANFNNNEIDEADLQNAISNSNSSSNSSSKNKSNDDSISSMIDIESFDLKESEHSCLKELDARLKYLSNNSNSSSHGSGSSSESKPSLSHADHRTEHTTQVYIYIYKQY